MKALEKDRGRRYATAGEFADDIVRHLKNEPVIAGPPSASYRLRKLLVRNRAAVVSASIVIIALVAGMIGTTTAMIQSTRHAEMATEQSGRAMTAVNFLLSTLSLTNPSVALNPNITVQTLLDHTSARVADEFADDPVAEIRVRSTIGRAYRRLGKYALAEPHLRRVIEMVDEISNDGESSSRALVAAGFDALEHYTVLWALTNICFYLERPDAFTIAGHARRVAIASIAETDPELAEQLHRFHEAVSSGAWSRTADAMQGVEELFEQASATAEASLTTGDPNWPVVADSLMDAGYTVWYSPHEPLGAKFWGKALEIQRRELPSNHPDTATTVGLLVGVLNKAGKLTESERLIRESVDALRLAHREGSFALAVSEGLLGETLTKQGRYEEAEPILLRSHGPILASVQLVSSITALESFTRIVSLYDGWNRPSLAEPYRDALAGALASSKYVQPWSFIRHTLGPEYPELVEAGDRVRALCGGPSYSAELGVTKAPGIVPPLRQLLALRAESFDDEEPRSVALARLLLGWANTLDPAEHVDARRMMAKSAYDVLHSGIDRYPLEVAEAASVLADCARSASKLDDAREHTIETLQALSVERPDGDWFMAAKEVRIARSLLGAGIFTPAEELLTMAYDVLRVQLGEEHTDTALASTLLFELYSAQDRPADAHRYRAVSSEAR